MQPVCNLYKYFNNVWQQVNHDVNRFYNESKVSLPDDTINPLDFIYARQLFVNKPYLLSNGYDFAKINEMKTHDNYQLLNSDHDRLRTIQEIKPILDLYQRLKPNSNPSLINLWKLLFLASKIDFRYIYLQTMFYSLVQYITLKAVTSNAVDFNMVDVNDPVIFTTNDIPIPNERKEIYLIEEMEFLITPQINDELYYLDAFLYTASIKFPLKFTMNVCYFLHVYRQQNNKEMKMLSSDENINTLYHNITEFYIHQLATDTNLYQLARLLIQIDRKQFKLPETDIKPYVANVSEMLTPAHTRHLYELRHVINIALFVYVFRTHEPAINDSQLKQLFDEYVNDVIDQKPLTTTPSHSFLAYLLS